MKKRTKTFIGLVVFVIILIVGGIFVYHPDGGKMFSEKMEKQALTANVQIMKQQTWGNEDNGGTAWSMVASGTIFKKEGQRYYVLTANHVLEMDKDADQTKIIVMDYKDEYYQDADVDRQTTMDEYYSQFPEAKVEFSDADYDLAVISFVSDRNYEILDIANQLPTFGEVVGTISNPYDKGKNQITTGRIISVRPTISLLKKYGINYPLLTHTARTSYGSSGSMLLNDKLEIIGVNLGGVELKLFSIHFFLEGKSMPCDRIRSFLAVNKFDI
jgi:serine protease Do